ncbi:MAG: DNA polymerase III subunit gamma/tau [Chlamydiae bacterium]|nr:DNA polymerase III subunit gamma/tau [Chlamydiota bacterium]
MSTVLPQTLKNPCLLIGASRSDALALAKELIGSAKIDSGNHPDLHIYIPEGKSDLHPMANMQTLIREMALPPFESPCKVFLIEDAEKMLPSASNALLKTLEEPSPDTFFILLTNHPDRLLPTVRSRLHPISYTQIDPEAFDLSPYLSLAQNEKWDALLDALPNLEEENPTTLFKGFLTWVAEQKNPNLFQKASALIVTSQKALDHNVKLRTVLLNLFLEVRARKEII